jgi:hypothetical protein
MLKIKKSFVILVNIVNTLEEILQQLNSVQKAQAHTRGEIQGLRTEFINRTTRGGRE